MLRDNRERILWDSNRLGRATQRQFHAAVQEVRGERVMVSPTVARELAPRVDVVDLERSIAGLGKELRIRQKLGRTSRGPGGTLEVAADLWRAKEWARPDGLYGIRRLNADEQARKNALLDEAPIAIFTEAVTREDVVEDADAHIICEALAMDAVLLMTHDKNTIKHEPLSLWTGALARQGVVSHPNVVRMADDVSVQWAAERPDEMVLASQLAAWPLDAAAHRRSLKHLWEEKLKRLARAGLAKTSETLKAAVGNNWAHFEALAERLEQGLPVQMRNAERRSPYTGWSRPEEPARRTDYSATWTGRALVLTHTSVSGRQHEWGRWERGDFAQMAKFLAARGIEMTDMPPAQDTGGFAGAMERTIETLERYREHGRS